MQYITMAIAAVLLVLPLCFGQFYESYPSSVWGYRIPSPDKIKIRENRIRSTTPFLPFSDLGASAGPHPRNDGTTKSRTTEDTLIPGLSLTNGLENGFTTLDLLHRGATKDGRNSIAINGSLGGLSPDEVYYADKDILIIKGGGFRDAQDYATPHQRIEEDFSQELFEKKSFPSPSEEYNGNIPTIVAPPQKRSKYWTKHPFSASQFYPFSLFLPATVFGGKHRKFIELKPSQTILVETHIERYDNGDRHDSQFNSDSPHINNENTRIYRHPERGYIRYFKNNLPSQTLNRRQWTKLNRQIPLKYKEYPPKKKIPLRYKEPPITLKSTPKKRPTWISLEDDINVNYKRPFRKHNPDAEILPTSVKLKGTISNPERFTMRNLYNNMKTNNFRKQNINIDSFDRLKTPAIGHRAPPKREDPSTWWSLEGDTAVNYNQNRPPINQYAERIPEFFNVKRNNNRYSERIQQRPRPAVKAYPIGVSIQRVQKPIK